MPEDRLAQLRRQRALVQEHLAWLEREIAETEKTGATEPAPASSGNQTNQDRPAPALSSSAFAAGLTRGRNDALEPAANTTDTQAEAVMEEYRVGSDDLQRDVRKGCFLYFAAALALLVAGVAGLYFALRH